MRTRVACIYAFIVVASYGLGATAQPVQGVTAGDLVVEPPTLISLGFEWYVEGDADRDAAVTVAYRRVGTTEWHDSLPLLRVQNERTFYVETLYFTAPNMFAGSVSGMPMRQSLKSGIPASSTAARRPSAFRRR